jgi:hypothetical protein
VSDEEGSVPIRYGGVLGHGPILGIGRMASPWPFLPFLFLFLFFLFFFSELFQIFCKNASNHFKQIPKFLKSSKQPSKPIRNMFSKAKHDFQGKL